MSEAIDAVTAFNQQQCVVNGGGGGTPGTPTGIPCSDSQGDLASPGTAGFPAASGHLSLGTVARYRLGFRGTAISRSLTHIASQGSPFEI